MLRLSCGEYEQMEFNNVKRGIYTTTSLLSTQLNRLQRKHALYLSDLRNFLREETNDLREEEM